MYSVSEAYITQMMKRGTRRRLSGTIGSVPFTGDDVVQGSFSVTGRATEESDTKIGGVYLGELEMTFVPSFISKVARTEYQNKVVSVSIGLWIPDTENPLGGEWVDVPIGVYTLQAPKISKQGISVTGYDNLYKLDKKFDIDQTSATPWGYLTHIANSCGVTLGQSQGEIEALPNGTELLGLHPDNDIETFRDLLYWLAQACGCFACADRAGNIVLRRFGNSTGVTFNEDHRDNDIVFSGYTTKWTGISFVDIDTQMTNYYGLEVDDGLTMNMGANPLLQIGSALAVDRRRRAVLYAVADIQYTPYYMNSARDPIFDLGDILPFSGGLSGGCTGCVMAYAFTLTNYTFEGFGDDPALANARSKTDKNISGLIHSTTENEVTFYKYANLDDITIADNVETEIASLAFMSAQTTTVKIMHEFLMDMVTDLASNSSYEVRYYLDNELLPYKPYEHLGAIQQQSGSQTAMSICRDFFYVLKDVEPNVRHTWKVKVITHGVQETSIQADHANIVIEGQRMYGESYFDGMIEVEENITVMPLGHLYLVAVSDQVAVIINNAAAASVSDNIAIYNVKTMQEVVIAEGTGELSPQVFLETEYGHIMTEDGNYITTEDGYRLIL